MKKTLVQVLAVVLLSVLTVSANPLSLSDAKPENVELEVILCRPVNTESATQDLKSVFGNELSSLNRNDKAQRKLFSEGETAVFVCDETQSQAIHSLLTKMRIEEHSRDLARVGSTTTIYAKNDLEGYSLKVTPTVDFDSNREGLVKLNFSNYFWKRVGVSPSGEPVVDHSNFETTVLLPKSGSVLCIQDGVVIFYQAKAVR